MVITIIRTTNITTHLNYYSYCENTTRLEEIKMYTRKAKDAQMDNIFYEYSKKVGTEIIIIIIIVRFREFGKNKLKFMLN